MQLEELQQALRDNGLEKLLPLATEESFGNLKAGRNADTFSQFESLAPLRATEASFGETVRIGAHTTLADTEQQQLAHSLRLLVPWRKGPFDVYGIHIDSEWNCALKWSRLKDQILPLKDRLVLDVGCGNGYYCFRMLQQGARLALGIEPHTPYLMQFLALKRLAPPNQAFVLPVTLEQLPLPLPRFDTVFSMGVLYHRRSPLDHLIQLRQCLRPGGELILETLYVDGPEGYSLVPPARYARMPNVWFLPGLETLYSWLQKCKFSNIKLIDTSVTTPEEQRATDWMPFESLVDGLSPSDSSVTIEGHPAPKRAIVTARVPE